VKTNCDFAVQYFIAKRERHNIRQSRVVDADANGVAAGQRAILQRANRESQTITDGQRAEADGKKHPQYLRSIPQARGLRRRGKARAGCGAIPLHQRGKASKLYGYLDTYINELNNARF
jgi:hypothetical protein